MPKLSEDERNAMTARGNELMTNLGELRPQLQRMNIELMPATRRQHELTERIRSTHAPGLYNADHADARKPMFDALMELAEKWGRKRITRTETAKLVKAYERELDTIRKRLAKDDAEKGAPVAGH